MQIDLDWVYDTFSVVPGASCPHRHPKHPAVYQETHYLLVALFIGPVTVATDSCKKGVGAKHADGQPKWAEFVGKTNLLEPDHQTLIPYPNSSDQKQINISLPKVWLCVVYIEC